MAVRSKTSCFSTNEVQGCIINEVGLERSFAT